MEKSLRIIAWFFIQYQTIFLYFRHVAFLFYCILGVPDAASYGDAAVEVAPHNYYYEIKQNSLALC